MKIIVSPKPIEVIVSPATVVNVSGVTTGREFIYEQNDNLTVWTIPHGLNKLYPHIIVKDLQGTTVLGEIDAIDPFTLQIRFTLPTTGIAYLYG
ncbi:MAG: hypothetical protein ACRDBG_04655 [Waterburya sp.]